MSENYSAQASITVKRMRNGDSIFLTLEGNGKPLFQAVDDQTSPASVSPDWTQAANQPVVTPHASTTRGLLVSLSNHSWAYNGVTLTFNGATSGDWITDSTGKFQLNTSTGAIKIIANLASATNLANDTLLYSCVATVAGVEYNMSKSVDIVIQKGGASSYYGFVTASTLQLDSSHTTATLVANLWLAGSGAVPFYVKWYKGNTEWTEKAGYSSITVGQSDVDGAQLIIAEFYLNQGGANYVYRYGVSIIDTMDEIIVVPYISSTNKEVDTGLPVTVSARIVRASTGTVLTPSSVTWEFVIMDGVTWEQKATSSSSSIQVTTAYTDQQDGSFHDVVVLVSASFTSLT